MFKALSSLAAAVALTASLSACDPSTVTPAAATTFIEDVQAIAKASCSVVPTALSVAALFSAGFASAEAAASAICAAISPAAPIVSLRVARHLRAKAAPPHAPVLIKGVEVDFVS